MCGIVGYVGRQDAKGIVLEGLRRLEYRGYDSCGMAIRTPTGLERLRVVGTVPNLEGLVRPLAVTPLAIGHTRWATHGAVTEANAHPHVACDDRLVIVHNGVIENFAELKRDLTKHHKFSSDTDTEVLAHVIESEYDGNLLAATRRALQRVTGTYAVLVTHRDEPESLVFARKGAPLLVGVGDSGHIVASDPTALLGVTRDVIYLEDEEVGRASPRGLEILKLDGRKVRREVAHIEWSAEQAEKGGFEHFMLKEIYEGPRAVRETTLGRLGITPPLIRLEGLPSTEDWGKVPRIRLLACGSSHHAALIGKHLIESLARVPCDATLASEYRLSPPVEERGTLAVAITQSGETADTLGALREAARRGLETLSIVNVEGSTAMREAKRALLTRAGPEIGVASTKTYLAQLAALDLLAIHLGEANRRGEIRELRTAANHLKQVPHALEAVLQRREEIATMARPFRRATNAFVLGRGPNHAAAQEAALKLKEIAYVHAEGYSSGELKHGPFALLTKRTPVVFLLPKDGQADKHLGTILEVRSRGSPVYGLAIGNGEPWKDFLNGLITLPEVAFELSPMVFGLATHLFAYEIAAARGLPIDRPRNLAKSVTVE